MTTASTGRPIPYALTATALAAPASPPAPTFCPSSPAADRPRYCDPADCCRDAFGPAAAGPPPAAPPAAPGTCQAGHIGTGRNLARDPSPAWWDWACRDCGGGFISAPPDDLLCPDCATGAPAGAA